MMQIIMATSNMDKVKEIRQILEGTEFQIQIGRAHV